MRSLLFFMLLGFAWFGTAYGAQDSRCDLACSEDINCYDKILRCLVEQGQAPQAVVMVKQLRKTKPGDPRWSVLLAKAYEEAGNHFWALKTLREYLLGHPEDCDATAYLAWIHLGQGDMDLAKEALSCIHCPKTQAEGARWALLLSVLAKTSGDRKQSVDFLRRIRSFKKIYPEDAWMVKNLKQQMYPSWVQPVHLKAEFTSGYTSNISAGLPVTQAGANKASGLVRLDLFGRWIWPLWPTVRPTVELSAKLNNLDDFQYEDQVDVHRANYFEGSTRLGLRLSLGSMPGLIVYRADVFSLNQGDRFDRAPLAFYEGHRLELELEPGGGLMIFAGGGRRLFRQISRSRTEVDGGLGWSFSSWNSLQVLAALSIRYYRADGALFDQTGATAILVSRLSLPAGMFFRAALSTGFDWYPNGAPEGSSNLDSGGTDLLVKPSIAVWGPSWGDFRVGASYEYSKRMSDSSISFSYSDHRVLLKMRWTYESDPWLPEQEASNNRLEFPWGATGGSGDSLDEERIQDLLRQDEASQRGSSCVN